ncbi:MAG: ankyrin repeat domain-containing protein [Gammaproteobacteria bacterium]|nr:ankyrin repeat domain-containing protein [Gammaproteobacteria bacterium]
MSKSRTRATMPALFAELDNPTLALNVPLIKSIVERNELTDENLHTLRNYTDPLGFNSLHYAAQELTTELVHLLVKDAPKVYVNTRNMNGITPLHMAVHGSANVSSASRPKDHFFANKELRKIPTLQTLLENKNDPADPNIPTTSGNTALHTSASEGQYAITALLLQHDADANLPNKVGNLPLHLAAISHKITNENIQVIELLASVTNNVNALNLHNETALHLAYTRNRFDIILPLLKSGASPSIKTALFSDSILKEHTEDATNMFIAMFNKNDGDKEKNILNETLKSSAGSTRKEFFTCLIKHFLETVEQITEAKKMGRTSEEALIRQTMLGIIISRITSGEDNKYTQEFTDAFFSLAKDKKLTVQSRDKLLLLAIDPSALNVGIDAIQEKINLNQNQNKINDILQGLKKEKVDQYPIHSAIEKGLAHTLAELIARNPLDGSVNKLRPTDNHTPLSLAVEKHMWDVVILLLKQNATSDLPPRPFEENLNKNILHLAIEDVKNNIIDNNTFKNVVEALKDKLHLIHLMRAKSKAGDTPASAAIKTDEPEIITILQEQSGELGLFLRAAITDGTPLMIDELSSRIPESKNIDSYQTENGETFLHVTSPRGAADRVEKLIELGADIDATTLEGNTSLHLAAAANATPAIQVLLNRGANPFAENRKQQTFLEVLINSGFNIEALLKNFDKALLFKSNPSAKSSLLSHILNHYIAEEKIPNEENLHAALTHIAKVDPEAFYKEFKATFDRIRAESNSGKLKPEEKLALLKLNKKLCELAQAAEPGLENLRKVKFHHFLKSPLPAKLIAEKKDLSEKMDALDRIIHKLEQDKPAKKSTR